MILGGIAMKTLGTKIWSWIKSFAKGFVYNFKEIFTTILEICAVAAIAIGASINWGQGWGLIIGGVLAIVMSFLSSIEPNQNRGN